MSLNLRASAGRRRRLNAPVSRGRRAFTVLEVLLVITLITMLTAVLVTGAVRLMKATPLTPEDVFWNAMGETRKLALLSGRDASLRFDAKGKDRALVARQLDGTEKRFPFATEGELTMDFLSTQKGSGSILLGGQLLETSTVPFVTFFGDGTCSPFRAQIRTGGAARILNIDPWTCAQVLTTDEASR